MRVLALDSSGSACSVALLDRGRLVAHRFEPMARGHAERLLPMAAEVVEAGGGDGFAALDLIAATIGPGAFTGIRIGLAAARAMGMAAGRPVVGITAFEAIAEAIPAEQRAGARAVLVAIDSRRENLFVQAIDPEGEPIGEAGDAPAAALASIAPPGPLIVAGDAAMQAAAALEAAGRNDVLVASGAGFPDAAWVARVAARRAAAGRDAADKKRLPPPRPLYLRAPAVTLPRRSGAP